MTKSKDQLIADVRNAYITKKLRPERCNFGLKVADDGTIQSRRGDCCAMGALAVGNMPVIIMNDYGQQMPSWSDVIDSIAADYGIELEDFTRGFDNMWISIPSNTSEDYLLGMKTWEAVKDLSAKTT